MNSPNFSKNNDMMADTPTDNTVSNYSFYSRLSHYMEGHKIGKSNCQSVELCILFEPGAFVCDMDLMKMDKKEKAFCAHFIYIIDEIDDKDFEDELFRNNMHRRYKSPKKDNGAESVVEIEAEMTDLQSFAKEKGNGSLAELPS